MTLYTYYGIGRITKIRKKRSIEQWFANSPVYERQQRVIDGGLIVAYKRKQTPGEMEDGKHCNRVLISYPMFIDDNQFKGSLERALDFQEAAETIVSAREKKLIREALRRKFYEVFPNHKEPNKQLKLF